MSFQELLESNINEFSYSDVLRKQSDITKLFPTFKDRVKAVAGNGGVRLNNWRKDLWHFKINSGTKDNVRYDAYIKFLNLPQVLADKISDKNLWKTDMSGIDLRKIAIEVLYGTDIELFCSCPAFLYWGPAYILTRRHAKYSKPENRPPKERNPREHGAVCKHVQLLLDIFPMYTPTMAKHLNRFFRVELKELENKYKKGSKKNKEPKNDKEKDSGN
jgi:hypothetical protein